MQVRLISLFLECSLWTVSFVVCFLSELLGSCGFAIGVLGCPK